ncbi:MAG: hypothetical protein ACFFCS_23515 [Candidatus Hodarchaeota archaeon]
MNFTNEAGNQSYHNVTYSSSGSYVLDPGVNGTYYATFTNPYSQSKEVRVTTERISDPNISGYDGIIMIGIIGFVSMFLVRKWMVTGKKPSKA